MFLIVFPASLGRPSQSKLNVMSQINMFEWDLTRLTTNAVETDGMWWKRNTFVKKNARCMHVHPHSESLYSYRIRNRWPKCIWKCLQMHFHPQNQGKDYDYTWLKQYHTRTHRVHTKKDTYPISDTICSTMCLLKVMMTNSFWKR